jgi:hypothetical protein
MIGAIVIKGGDIHQAKIKWGEDFVDDVMLKCSGKHPSVLYKETEDSNIKECLELLFKQELDI